MISLRWNDSFKISNQKNSQIGNWEKSRRLSEVRSLAHNRYKESPRFCLTCPPGSLQLPSTCHNNLAFQVECSNKGMSYESKQCLAIITANVEHKGGLTVWWTMSYAYHLQWFLVHWEDSFSFKVLSQISLPKFSFKGHISLALSLRTSESSEKPFFKE